MSKDIYFSELNKGDLFVDFDGCICQKMSKRKFFLIRDASYNMRGEVCKLSENDARAKRIGHPIELARNL